MDPSGRGNVTTIKIDDILGFLVADTLTPSTMGAQLDRLRFGLVTTPDPFQAREDAEARLLEHAELLRCIDQFKAVLEFRPVTSKAAGYKTLERIQRGTSPRLSQGAIALNILRVYQHWGSSRPHRALLAVFGYVRSIAPRMCPTLDLDLYEALQAFADGRAKRSHDLAASAYADALLALGSFLTKRNRCRN